MTAPYLLFAPYYKRGGTGEYVRAVAMAQAAQRRWPEARIEFLLPGGAETRHDCPFPHVFNNAHLDKPQRVVFLNHEIGLRRPQVVIFDCYSAPVVLDRCREVGARSVYIADQAGTCKRAFEWQWLWRLDAHWEQREFVNAPAFTFGQNLKALISRTRRAQFDIYFDELPLDVDALPTALRDRLDRPFALLVPGGGGYKVDGRYVGELMFDAAERLHAATGLDAITVLGPLHQGEPPSGATAVVKSLDLPVLISLMRRAKLVITNGAGSLHQAMACGAPCVATPLGGIEQPRRIAGYVRDQLLLAATPEAGALAAAAARLLTAEGEALRQRVAALGVVNGIPLMMGLIEEQLHLRQQALAR